MPEISIYFLGVMTLIIVINYILNGIKFDNICSFAAVI